LLIENDGLKIHYEVEGDGPAIVMRTGAGGDLSLWREAGYVAGLPDFRCILVDQRGRGLSGRPTTVESHRIDRHVSDIMAVLDAVGIDSAGFVAYSNGINIGVAFESAHPGRLKALVGIGSLSYRNLADLPRPPDMQAEIERIVEAGGVRAEYLAFAKEENDRFPEAIHRSVMEGDPLMRALDSVAARDWKGPLELYPGLHCPVLMVTGDKEDPERDTERSAAKIPNARVVRSSGQGHLSNFYRGDLTLQHIRPFLLENLR
jgi:pimeloyl-ACP methyl ester carboxylesterase